MNLALYRRSKTSKQIALFLTLSVGYLYTISIFSKGLSPFSKTNVSEFLIEYSFIISIHLACIYTVYRGRKLSKFLFLCCMASFTYIIFSLFFAKFDKFILILGTSYLFIALYFRLLWILELSKAIYNPGFRTNEVGDKSFYVFNCFIKSDKIDDISGHLTNWDRESCFIVLNRPLEVKLEAVKIVMEFEGQYFQQHGTVVSRYGQGVGIQFTKNEQADTAVLDWNELYTIICHRGYDPHL